MKHIKHHKYSACLNTLCLLLASALLLTFTHHGSKPGDVDFSGQTDLKNAIISLQAFTDNPHDELKIHVKQIITAFQALAGINTVIIPADDKINTLGGKSFYCLLRLFSGISPELQAFFITAPASYDKSMIFPPPIPPPEFLSTFCLRC